jgi:hypothetical protein
LPGACRIGISNPMVLGPPIPPCQMKEFTALRITSYANARFCAYWLTPQGGIVPRFRRDGTPDCPEADIPTRAIAPPGPIISGQAVRDAVTGLGRGLDALKREVERLADQIRRP